MKKTLNEYKGGIQSHLSTSHKKYIKKYKLLKDYFGIISKYPLIEKNSILTKCGNFYKVEKLNGIYCDKKTVENNSEWFKEINKPIEESKDIKKSNFKKYWLKKTGWNFTKFNEGDIYLENKLNKVIKKLNSLSKENK